MDKSYVNKVKKLKQTSIITLQQAKQQLNVDDGFIDDNEIILSLIEAATSEAESFTGTDIALTMNTLEFIRFCGSGIIVNEAPYKEVVSITTTTDGVETVLDASDYEVNDRIIGFQILFKDNIEADKLVLVFNTGYDIDEAPARIIQAILVRINSLYDEERSGYMIGANLRDIKTFERLLSGNTINRW
jgi:hypothetical protein